MTLNEKKKLYLKANKAYNNGDTSPLTDAQFDKLEREIAKEDPDWVQLKKTGAKVGKKVEVRLPAFMPSLHKRYPEDIDKWVSKQKQVLMWSHKLDGSALIGRYRAGRCEFLATRGDGTLGKDISFLIPFLNLPKIAAKGEVLMRFEALMRTQTFKAKYTKAKLGEKKGFDNARNMVAGLLNRQDASPYLKDVDLVVLGVYDQPIHAGLSWAARQGLMVATRNLIHSNRTAEDFERLLANQRKVSAYDIDGLVLIDPDQTFAYDSADRPKFTVAFKVNDDENAVTATVVAIVWQLSRTGRWTPKIEIKPISIGGVTVTYATAHNAQWMTERRIGVGAVVKLVRSGDVIPKIVGVVKKAAQPSHPPGEFYEKGVHYYATERSKDADVREIHHFFSTLGIEHIAQKTVAKLYDAGLTTVLDHMNAYGVRMKGYREAGVGEAMTSKIYDEFSRVFHKEGVTLIKLMNASNCFESFGERKLQMIEDHYVKQGDSNPMRTFVKMKAEDLARDRQNKTIESIKGMGSASSEQFFDGLWRFYSWFKPLAKTKLVKINAPEMKTKKVSKGKLSGQFVSFTGYRSEEQEQALTTQGAEIIKLGAKTTILLYNPKGKFMAKVDAARAKGIKVCTYKELIK